MVANNEALTGVSFSETLRNLDERLQEHIEKIVASKGTPLQPDVSIFLDTATRYTGYAMYRMNKPTKTATLCGYGNFKATENDWEARCLELTSKISAFIRYVKPAVLTMEFPTFQAGATGMSAARGGDTIKLAYLCGRISTAWEFYITKVMKDTGMMFNPAHLLTFGEWAGQVPKHVTCLRLKEHFGIEANPDTHDNDFADAIMMGKKVHEVAGITVSNVVEGSRADY